MRTGFLDERIGRAGLRDGSPERLSSDRIGGVRGHQRSCSDDCLFRGDPMDDLLNRAQVLRATADEDAQLRTLIKAGKSSGLAAAKLKRSITAVKARAGLVVKRPGLKAKVR